MRIGQLDSLRGIFALLIFAYHAPIAHVFMNAELVRNGYVAVYFFFVLSGFVIMLAYGDRIGSPADAARFAFARLARLWPLHLFVLFLIAARTVGRVVADDLGIYPYELRSSAATFVGDFLREGFLLHAFANDTSREINSVSWSIAVEFWIYLLFAAALLFGGRRIALGVMAAMIAIGFAVVSGVVEVPFGNARTGLWLGFVYFPLGVFAYLAFRTLHDRGWRVGTGVELACVAVFAAVIVAWDLLPAPHAWAAAAFGGGMVLLALGDGAVSGLLNRPFFRMLGDRSYSIYMMHMFMLSLFGIALRLTEKTTGWTLFTVRDFAGNDIEVVTLGSPLAANLGFVGLGLLIIYVSGLTYRYVEWPAQNAARRRIAARAASRRAAEAEPRTA